MRKKHFTLWLIVLLLCTDVVGFFIQTPMVLSPALSLTLLVFLFRRNKEAFFWAPICATAEIVLCAIYSFLNNEATLFSTVILLCIGLAKASKRCLICRGFEKELCQEKEALAQFSQTVQGGILVSATAYACVSAISLPLVFLSLLIEVSMRVAYISYVVLMLKFAKASLKNYS